MSTSMPKEPSSLGFWLFVGGMLFLCVPYLFLGVSEPRFLGLPVWLYVSVAAALAIAAVSVWRIWRRWDVERHLP